MAVLTGSCACGALKYEVTAQPLQKALCHCRNCQKLTGTAFTTNLLVPSSSFKVTAGKPKFWSFKQEPSGIAFLTTFCGTCGTNLRKESDDKAFSDVSIVQAGTVDEGDAGDGRPVVELWTPMRKSWVGAVEGATQAEGFQ